MRTLAVQGFSVERVPGIERAWPACRSDPGRGGGGQAWYVRPRQGHMIFVSAARGGRGRVRILAVQGFSVERVTGIEPAWPAWKASGTRS